MDTRKTLSTKVTHETDPTIHPFFKKCVGDLSVYTPYVKIEIIEINKHISNNKSLKIFK